jgi:hypothetical protein
LCFETFSFQSPALGPFSLQDLFQPTDNQRYATTEREQAACAWNIAVSHHCQQKAIAGVEIGDGFSGTRAMIRKPRM